MTRVTKPVEERRQEIIDTSRILFLENGFNKTQMADISRKMNVAAGTIYHYFKSKTEILYAVIDEITSEKTQNISRILSDTQGSAFDRLILIFTSSEYVEIFEKLVAGFADDPAILEYCKRRMNSSAMPLLVSLIEQGNADGSWNCTYPLETASFIQQAMPSFASKAPDSGDLSQGKSNNNKAYTDIVFRVLGVEKTM